MPNQENVNSDNQRNATPDGNNVADSNPVASGRGRGRGRGRVG